MFRGLNSVPTMPWSRLFYVIGPYLYSSFKIDFLCVWVLCVCMDVSKCVQLCAHMENRKGYQVFWSITLQFIPLRQDLSLNPKWSWCPTGSSNPFASTFTVLSFQVSASKPCFLHNAGALNSGPVQQRLLPAEPFHQPQPLVSPIIYKIRGLN